MLGFENEGILPEVCFYKVRRQFNNAPEENHTIVFYIDAPYAVKSTKYIKLAYNLFKDIWPMHVKEVVNTSELPKEIKPRKRWRIELQDLTCYPELCVIGNLFHVINEDPTAADYIYHEVKTEKDVMTRLKFWPKSMDYCYTPRVNVNHISVYAIKPERESFKEMRDYFLEHRTGGIAELPNYWDKTKVDRKMMGWAA